VKRGGRLHPLPEGITGLVPSRLKPLLTTSILSPLGRLRAGLEALIPARRSVGEESIAQFVTRRFGQDAYDWLVEPLLSGIYAGDGARLSLDATFPMLSQLEREHGSILRGIMGRSRSASGGAPPAGFMTPVGGLAELVEGIERRLPAGSVHRGVASTGVERGGAGYRVSLEDGVTITADQVILATPAFAAAGLVERLDPELARELREIPFVSTATVSLAFAASAVTSPLEGYGYVSPRAEGGPVVACTVTSNKFPDRVPAGAVLIRLFIGRAGHESLVEQPESVLVDIARTELAQVFGIRAAPEFTRVFRWRNSMPQYVVGHPARLARLEQLRSAHPGLQLAGASYRGVGIPDCIGSGWAAASAVLGSAKVAA